MATPRNILITGANRGIGYHILQALATESPMDRYIIAARSQESIEEAISTLRETPEIGSRIENTRIEGVALDVTNDSSIRTAVASVKERFGCLHVLVNNAGIAIMPTEDLTETRQIYNSVLDVNVTSVANVTSAFLPLLQEAVSGKLKPLVVNISSGRASLKRSTNGSLPPTQSVPYSVSKVALNALTIEFAKNHPEVTFQCANPGHCRTQFNGYRGTRDPLEGAQVVVELLGRQTNSLDKDDEELKHAVGFWETIGSEKELIRVPW